MPKVSPLQSTFNGGEFSPLLHGRVDIDRYKTGLATCLNYIPTIQGGLTRRPGTVFVAEVKNSAKSTRLQRFEFSTIQAYMLEFSDLKIRFYMDQGQILSLGTPYEVTTPYLEADLFQLKFTQSADVLYITHPDYAPRKLSRTGHTSWTLTVIDFLDGPYLATNNTAVTITPSATSGSVNLTLSSISAVNGGVGWATTDVGRLVRIQDAASNWTWAQITARTSATVAVATIRGAALSSTAARTSWRLGVWSDTDGYPGVVTFHEDRLVFAGATLAPERFDASNSSDYENFAPTSPSGTVLDNQSLSFSLNSNDVNVIRWLSSDEKGMLAGTAGGEWVIKPSVQTEALSPTNISAKPVTVYGSADIQPFQAGKSTIFVQRSGRKLREMTYFFDVDGFRCPDVTVLAEHVTGATGVVQLAYQREPQSIVWAARADGYLIGMTYERDLDSLKVAWHRHQIGGQSDAAGTNAVVESVACIPSPDGTHDDLWMVVRRRINGGTKRYVEFLSKIFEDFDEQNDAFFVDGGLTYDDPKTISAATKANPGVITATSHGFSNGNTVIITDIKGMTQLNGRRFVVASVTTHTFALHDSSGNNINTSAYSTYVSGGEVRKLVTTISGLDHLEGETVDILADGAVQPSKTIASGAITLSQSAGTVQIGYGYNSDAQMLRLEAGAADGTALGKTRRSNRVGFLLHRSLGLKIGTDFDNLDTVTFRKTSDAMTRAVPLFSGIISETIEADYDFENQIAWRQSQPLPSTVLAVFPQMETQDR